VERSEVVKRLQALRAICDGAEADRMLCLLIDDVRPGSPLSPVDLVWLLGRLQGISELGPGGAMTFAGPLRPWRLDLHSFLWDVQAEIQEAAAEKLRRESESGGA
jgi:hypothetical protein